MRQKRGTIAVLIMLSLAATCFTAYAKDRKFDVRNDTSYDFQFKDIRNKDHVNVEKDDRPETIYAGTTATIKFRTRQSSDNKRVQFVYSVSNPADDSESEIRMNWNNKEGDIAICKTDSPTYIKGDYNHCSGGSWTWVFEDK